MKQYLGRTIRATFISKPQLLGESYGILQFPLVRLLEPIIKQRISAGPNRWKSDSLKQYANMLTGCAKPKERM